MIDFVIRFGPWIAFILVMIWIVSTNLYPRYQNYRRNQQLLDEIDDKYENLRKMRADLIYHIDWAIDRGETRQARELETELERIDKELEELRDRYHAIEKGKGSSNKII
ncbi:unnamed protein product [Blepharisma stoltei]|uniref:Phage shock protein B n=1 Tax=Blepharisma stoltei TaxID=1481888 RepID=A0AAU9KER9_9CILI|nr:unnamed protein product [Blepharisma stoltei]